MEIKSILSGKRGVSLPFSDKCKPLITDQKNQDAIFEDVISYGRKAGWKSIGFRGGNRFFDGVRPYSKYIFSSVELGGDSSSLKRKFRSSTRRNIRKAIKSGLETKIVRSRESVKEFYRLNCLTRKLHGIPPQPFYFFETVFKRVISKNKGFVCLVFHQGTVIAGLMFFYSNGHIIYKYGASDRRFSKFRPNNVAMWTSIKWAIDNNFKAVDFGRTELHHAGQLQFKRGWNTTETELNYYRFDILKNSFISVENEIQSSYYIFKKFPLPILKVVGKILYRHIG